MTIELTMLLYSALLTFALILVPATEAILRNGASAQAGARDALPEPSIYYKRAKRLVENMLENMVLFATLVLIAHAANISNENTALGAQIFFYARLFHAISYLAGWPWIRPLFWAVSLIGMGLIVFELF